MDYIRKKHWVKYQSPKCKVYLRNDFQFTCAYCGMREQDNIAGEQYFEKDHFIPKQTPVECDLDSYNNMVYACSKCNGRKTDQQLNLILDPCKDNIYGGESPHIRRLGEENQFKLQALTTQGEMFINSMQLNSRFYRKMREKQEGHKRTRKNILELLQDKTIQLPRNIANGLKMYLEDSPDQEKSDEFRCGISNAGEGMYNVLLKLQEKQINHYLCLEDDDLDVLIEYGKNTYYCEIRINEYTGAQKRGPRIKAQKYETWLSTGKKCGILYYYKNKDILELYLCEETGLRQCDFD